MSLCFTLLELGLCEVMDPHIQFLVLVHVKKRGMPQNPKNYTAKHKKHIIQLKSDQQGQLQGGPKVDIL